MSRLVTFVVAIALLIGLLDAGSMPVRRNETISLDASLNRIAVVGDSYTTGGELGGLGGKGWTTRAWTVRSAPRCWSRTACNDATTPKRRT